MRSLPLAIGVFVLGPLVVALTLESGFDPAAHAAAQPLVHRENGYTGSGACRSCHPDQHASWTKTFHRTMTQEPSPESVRGSFDGRELHYAGRTARPFLERGTYFMEVPTPQGGRRAAEVALVVGSRRYQQYFERVEHGDGFEFLRLPFLWHIEAGQWLHLNTVFLSPDRLSPETLEWLEPDFDSHRDRWNSNCVFCHNTAPRPGEIDFGSKAPESPRAFDSEVAELGIACEACHGPGAEHARKYENPLRRYGDHAEDGNDARIVHPDKLGQTEAVAVCGQCHGQLVPRAVRDYLTSGPTFRPGDALLQHVEPISFTLPLLEGQSEPGFKLRFWEDGTARLTAYEYQGVVQSPCYQLGTMTCGSCHEMHAGDPRGMIEEAKRGNGACLQCHAEMAQDIGAHTGHDPRSSGSACLECHMPRMVYGVLDVHRSHRIESPDPRRDGEHGRPHACTLCHLDRSLSWSAERMGEMWHSESAAPRFRRDGAPLELADGLASILAGDAVVRAVYAKAMGQGDRAVDPRDKAFMRAALGMTIGDPYPSVRWIARKSLLALERELPIGMSPRLAQWDHMDGSAASRVSMFTLLREELRSKGPGILNVPPSSLLMRPDMSEDAAMHGLSELQSANVISIGE